MRPLIRQTYINFVSSVRPIEHLMERIQLEAIQAMRDGKLRAQHASIQCGSIVLLSGYLEAFLRSCCENYFVELSSRGVGMQHLGQKYLEVHLREGAGFLADIIKRESRKNASSLPDSSAFVKRLVAPIADASKSPAWEAFARTQGNPSAKVIKQFLAGLGISGGLGSLDAAIDGRYSANTIEQLLTNFIDVRNECAHSGVSASLLTPSQILDLAYFVRSLTLGICRLVSHRATEVIALQPA